MTNAALEAFIDKSIKVSAENKYFPTNFIAMRARYGTVQAISRLVISGDIQSGFTRMRDLGLIDYTIEAAVLKFPDAFGKHERECAEFRLKTLNSSK